MHSLPAASREGCRSVDRERQDGTRPMKAGHSSVSCWWRLSRCDKPVRVERTGWGRPGRPLRCSARRYSSQRDEFRREEMPRPAIN